MSDFSAFFSSLCPQYVFFFLQIFFYISLLFACEWRANMLDWSWTVVLIQQRLMMFELVSNKRIFSQHLWVLFNHRQECANAMANILMHYTFQWLVLQTNLSFHEFVNSRAISNKFLSLVACLGFILIQTKYFDL